MKNTIHGRRTYRGADRIRANRSYRPDERRKATNRNPGASSIGNDTVVHGRVKHRKKFRRLLSRAQRFVAADWTRFAP